MDCSCGTRAPAVAPVHVPTAPQATQAPASALSPAAPAAPARPAPTTSATHARAGVLLIGDSLSVGTKPYLTSALAGQPVRVDATSGISLAEGMRRYHATANKPRVVEMALFTNNSPGDLAQLRSALAETVADARARGGKVVWATIVRPGNYDAANALIRQYAARNPDVMGLVDWAKLVQQHPGYVGGDHVHGTVAGYRARAQAFADAAR